MVTKYDQHREMVTVLLKIHDRISVYRVVADVIPDKDIMVIQAEQQADQPDHEPEQLMRLVEALGKKVMEEARDRRRILLQEAEDVLTSEEYQLLQQAEDGELLLIYASRSSAFPLPHLGIGRIT